MFLIAFISRRTLYSQPGGDTVQVEETAKALRKLGFAVDIILSGQTLEKDYDLIHFFNLGRPADLLPYFPLSAPLVVSPIFVDYQKSVTVMPNGLKKKVLTQLSAYKAEYFKTLFRGCLGRDNFPGWGFLLNGQKNSIQKILDTAFFLLPTTFSEARRLQSLFELPDVEVIGLGVSEVFATPKENIPRKGIICAGRIEYRKNQLALIKAMKDSDIPLTIVGDPAKNQPEYFELCKKEAGENTTFLPKVSQDELAQLYKIHRVLAMPSLFETYGLTGIEAAACGCRVAYLKGSDADEIYHDFATVLPSNEAFWSAVLEKLHNLTAPVAPFNHEKFDWNKVGEKTAEIYKRLIN